MVAIREEQLGFLEEVFLEVWNLATNTHGTQCGLSPDVGVRGRKEGLDFGEKVSGHFDRGDVTQGAEGESDNILVRVVEITMGITRQLLSPLQRDRAILFERVGNQCQNFLVLIQKQHSSEIPQSLVGETMGRQQLQTFDLTEMCPFPEGE